MRKISNLKILKSLNLIILAFTFFSPSPAYAVDIGQTFKFGKNGIVEIFPSISSLVNAILPNIFVITGVIFLIILIFAGIGIIVNGGGDQESAKKAKSAATSAALGLALVFGAYWLMQIIEFVTGIKIFNSIL